MLLEILLNHCSFNKKAIKEIIKYSKIILIQLLMLKKHNK